MPRHPRFALPAFSYKDPALGAGTGILSQHLTDLRTAIREVYVKAGRTPLPVYTDDPLAAGTAIKAIHISQIRAAVIRFRGGDGGRTRDRPV